MRNLNDRTLNQTDSEIQFLSLILIFKINYFRINCYKFLSIVLPMSTAFVRVFKLKTFHFSRFILFNEISKNFFFNF
jgi:hypothetical protein